MRYAPRPSVPTFVVTALALALGGCGSDGPRTAGTGDGGAGSSVTGSGTSGNGGGAGSGGATATPALGHVNLLQSISRSNGAPTYKLKVAAGFGDGAVGLPGVNCSVEPQGPCEVTICDKVEGEVPSSGTLRSAGNIQVQGAVQPVTLTPKTDKSYPSAEAESTAGPILAPGAAFSIKAVGADVPAFEGAVKVTGPIQVESPVFNGLMMTTLPKGPLEVRWTGVASQVQVYLTAESGTKIVAATCRYTGSSGTVPAPVINSFGSTGAMWVGTEDVTRVKAGTGDVELRALSIVQAGVFNK